MILVDPVRRHRSGEYTPPPPSTSGSCRSRGARTVPTRGGRVGERAADAPSDTGAQRTGKFLVRHPGGSTSEALHQPHLLAGELVAVPGKCALEVLPRLTQEVRVPHSPASHLSQNVLAHGPPSGTTAVAASVYRGTRRRNLPHAAENVEVRITQS
jgi:hypothetical protein